MGITQSDLAERAGVSQPLIARIESGSVDPRYSTLCKIIRALDEFEMEQVCAGDIMHSPVIHTHPSDPVEDAVEIMQEHGFSQMPVIESGVPVGSISEENVVQAISRGSLSKQSTVGQIMDDSFPTVSPGTDVNVVSPLLEHNHAVLVLEKGQVVGVITKHNLMSLLRY